MRLYSGDKVTDFQYIWSSCWSHFNAYGMPAGKHMAEAREPIVLIAHDMYDRFPGKISEASPFKLMAWFITCFMFHTPLKKPFNISVAGLENEQNALVAYNTACISMRNCKIHWKGGDRVISCAPDDMLSAHSRRDVINLLREWGAIEVKTEDLTRTFYRNLSLLIEQITYRAIPSLSYPPSCFGEGPWIPTHKTSGSEPEDTPQNFVAFEQNGSDPLNA